jgi:hypothetical protein
MPQSNLKCDLHVLSNKLKSQMINSCVQICNLAKINALMNKVDQASGINGHITFKRIMVIIVHEIYTPFSKFYCYYEIINKIFHNCANLIKGCIAPNSGY